MKSSPIFNFFVAALACGVIQLRAEIDILTASPAELYDKGFDAFVELRNPTKKRLEGYSWMVRAAVAGHQEAQMVVAGYDAGFVTPTQHSGAKPLLEPNLTRALRFFRELTDAGSASARVKLALLYSSGVGEPRHADETPQALLLQAAGKGNEDAMQHLGRRYLVGHGVTPDLLEAARWSYQAFKLNAHTFPPLIDEQGNPLAQDNALSADCAAVVSLFARADQGHGPAAAALAARYTQAGHIPEARALYRHALKRGHTAAAKQMQALPASVGKDEKEPPLAWFFGEGALQAR